MAKSTKKATVKKSNKGVIIAIATIIVIGAIFTMKVGLGISKGNGAKNSVSSSGNNGLVIPKSEVTETVKFYSYSAGKTKMEVMAVKAPDGSIRTALNTCQICYASGRGYYKQEGDEVVCRNCGNRFKINQIEKIKGGCNPVPVLKENKTDDGSNIIISNTFLEKSKILFANWGK